jgi:hypothetical protein
VARAHRAHQLAHDAEALVVHRLVQHGAHVLAASRNSSRDCTVPASASIE